MWIIARTGVHVDLAGLFVHLREGLAQCGYRSAEGHTLCYVGDILGDTLWLYSRNPFRCVSVDLDTFIRKEHIDGYTGWVKLVFSDAEVFIKYDDMSSHMCTHLGTTIRDGR